MIVRITFRHKKSGNSDLIVYNSDLKKNVGNGSEVVEVELTADEVKMAVVDKVKRCLRTGAPFVANDVYGKVHIVPVTDLEKIDFTVGDSNV